MSVFTRSIVIVWASGASYAATVYRLYLWREQILYITQPRVTKASILVYKPSEQHSRPGHQTEHKCFIQYDMIQETTQWKWTIYIFSRNGTGLH